jgi:hypothetical protein
VDAENNIYTLTRADDPEQVGTPLNKANLLTDETAALVGLDNTATPNDMFSALAGKTIALDGKKLPEFVVRVGTGGAGASSPCELTFSKPVSAVYWIGGGGKAFVAGNLVGCRDFVNATLLTAEYKNGYGFANGAGNFASSIYAKISADRKTVSWYFDSRSASNQLNTEGVPYYFMGFVEDYE